MSDTGKVAERRLGAGHTLCLMSVAPLLAQRQLSDKNSELATAQIPPSEMEKGKEQVSVALLEKAKLRIRSL